MKDQRYGYLFISPAIITIILVLGVPMLVVVGLSFTNYRPMRPIEWVGFKNFIDIVNNEQFWTSVKNTFVFTLFSVLFHVLFGLFAALLLNNEFKGRKLLRIIYLLPWMLSQVVAAITWRWILNGSYGIFNEFLLRLGLIESYKAWLGDPDTAMLSVIVTNVWKQFPFIMLMILARLQAIPKEQYEAAWVEGANWFQGFFYVTLPNLKNVIVIASTLDFIWSFKQFDLIYVMTAGGPGDSTEVFSSLVYRYFNISYNYGRASAVGIILLIIVFIVSLSYARMIFKQEEV